MRWKLHYQKRWLEKKTSERKNEEEFLSGLLPLPVVARNQTQKSLVEKPSWLGQQIVQCQL